jgi:hypothetical protein
MAMMRAHEELLEWLHRLDSCTNAEFGRPRTACVRDSVCVACGKSDSGSAAAGLCAGCRAQRVPDQSEVVLFRPMARRQAAGKSRTT